MKVQVQGTSTDSLLPTVNLARRAKAMAKAQTVAVDVQHVLLACAERLEGKQPKDYWVEVGDDER